METIRVRKFRTIAGYDVFINMDNVVRIWFDKEKGHTALMYVGGLTDHVEETLREVLYGKGCN